MKFKEYSQKIQASIRKRYARKKDIETLTSQVKKLQKQVAKLEKCCESLTEPVQSVTRPVQSANKSAQVQAAEKAFQAVKQAVQDERASTELGPKDELTRIKGIGSVLEKKLHGLGITQFAQIANWKDEDVEKIAEHLNFKGRIEREGWIKQAKKLM